MRILACITAIALCLSLCGCSLLPQEDQIRFVPLVEEYQQEAYDLAAVTRKDLRKTVSLSCSFISVESETLYFGVDGEPNDKVFVAKGEKVKAGQLLAQLSLEGLDEELEDLERSIRQLELRCEALEENRALDLDRKKLTTPQENLEEALKAVNRQYDDQKQTITDEMDLIRMQIDQNRQKIAQRQVRATMDGTLTYLYPFEPNEVVNSTKQRVALIENLEKRVFRLRTVYWDRFAPGQVYSVDCVASLVEAEVVTATELGLEEEEKKENRAAFIYLRPTISSLSVPTDYGMVLELELDFRENALVLPAQCVHKGDIGSDVYYVYCVDNFGFRHTEEVQVGITVDGWVEILSGLHEGDPVVMG